MMDDPEKSHADEILSAAEKEPPKEAVVDNQKALGFIRSLQGN